MLVLSSSNLSLTNLEEDQIESQQLIDELNDVAEKETKISFLNTESNDDLGSNPKQESQTFHKVSSSSQVDNLANTDDVKKEVALSNLEAALSQINQEEDISNQSFHLNHSDEIAKVMPISIKSSSEKLPEEETEVVFKDYRQTFYSVTAGEVKVGYGLTYQDDSVKVIDNVMHYYDDEYEWLPIVAVNIDEVLEVGLNERGIPNYYGTILEITYPKGNVQKAIVLDACGACRRHNRIDLWVYDHDYQHDITGIEYRIVREGFKDDKEQS
ncbi:MAG: hypothetical protein II005_03550 [Turicibacter sp.]|nr:hypothetical protein [Turicibacter sp.]MBQ4163792.1 hypothetical protein [Turicibacter sp.]